MTPTQCHSFLCALPLLRLTAVTASPASFSSACADLLSLGSPSCWEAVTHCPAGGAHCLGCDHVMLDIRSSSDCNSPLLYQVKMDLECLLSLWDTGQTLPAAQGSAVLCLSCSGVQWLFCTWAVPRSASHWCLYLSFPRHRGP